MPSQLHEALLLLFRNRPELAPELLRDALRVELPSYTRARIESADLTDVQPAEYRADLVVLLCDEEPVLGIVVEAQLAPDERKRYTWPAYATGLRARIECPVCVLVISPDEGVASWARASIGLGAGNHFRPLVIGPRGVPVVTRPEQAQADPELAVLSAMAHGRDLDPDRALQVAVAAMQASQHLDSARSVLYFDLVYASLSEAARKMLAMDPAKYEFQSEFAKRYFSEGRAQGEAVGRAQGEALGRAQGRAAVVLKLLALKFGSVPQGVEQRVQSAPAEQLDYWAERILGASTLDEVFA